ncbi:hypothetical protein ABIE67_000353 [Streptomyces sp. V4I8]
MAHMGRPKAELVLWVDSGQRLASILQRPVGGDCLGWGARFVLGAGEAGGRVTLRGRRVPLARVCSPSVSSGWWPAVS